MHSLMVIAVCDMSIVSGSGADTRARSAGCGSCTNVCIVVKCTSCLCLWWITKGTTDTWSRERWAHNCIWCFLAYINTDDDM